MARLRSIEDIQNAVEQHSEAHLLVGFGSKIQYHDFEAVVSELRTWLRNLEERCGDKPWLLVYGGDEPNEAAPDVGLLAQRLANTAAACRVMVPLVSSLSDPPPPQTFVDYYYVMEPQYDGGLEEPPAVSIGQGPGSTGEDHAIVAAGAAAADAVWGCRGSTTRGKRSAPGGGDGNDEVEGGDPSAGNGGGEGREKQRRRLEGVSSRQPEALEQEQHQQEQQQESESAPAADLSPAAPVANREGISDRRGRQLWGGVINGRPVGPSRFCLSDIMLGPVDQPSDEGRPAHQGNGARHRLITSVLAVGGGQVALQELEYASSRGVPWTYIRCRGRNTDPGSEYGPLDSWAQQQQAQPPAPQPPPQLPGRREGAGDENESPN